MADSDQANEKKVELQTVPSGTTGREETNVIDLDDLEIDDVDGMASMKMAKSAPGPRTQPISPPAKSEGQITKTQSDLFVLRRRSALPSFAKSGRFEWHNVNVYVGHGDKKRQILHNFNGVIQSGELLAVMGGSGAGKSTLLNVLSGRTNLNEQEIEGELALNGKKFPVSKQQIIRSLCTYVPQSDILCPTQTVEEALTFYAKLKLSHLETAQQLKRINYLIEVLKLDKCRKNLIGDERKRGISGGEKRRVSIASEILNEPDIIFLDEPTSGLDAYTAARTIKTLKEFCNVSNKIIIATIHQPSMEVFYLFDKLILLSAGKCCFNSFLEDISEHFIDSIRPKTNPADVIVFEAQRESEKMVEKWEKSSLNFYDAQGIMEENMKWKTDYERITFDNVKKGEKDITAHTNISMASMFLQYKLLLIRDAKSYYRDSRVTIIRLVQVLFFAIACGGIYFDIRESYNEKERCFILITLVPMLIGMVSLLVVFPQQKLLFTREHNSNTYGTTAWALSTFLLEIPRELIHMIIFIAIVYPMIGLDGNFVSYWFTLFLAAYSGGTFGLLIGVVSKTMVDAAQMVPLVLIPIMLFSDFIIPVSTLPAVISWLVYVDPLYFLMRCLFLIEFYGTTYSRTVGSDEQQICNRYAAFQNGTILDLFNISSLLEPVNCTAEINDVITTYNITNYDGYTLDSLNNILININTNANADADASSMTTSSYSTTSSLQDREQRLNSLCATEQTASSWLSGKGLDDGNVLGFLWLYLVIICIAIRMLSILILVINNNDGFGWLKKKIRYKICPCCFNENDGDDDNDKKTQGDNDEISPQSTTDLINTGTNNSIVN